MTVIAMTREMGSRGRDVALLLAERLNLELVQHEIVASVAEKMHVRETSVNRFLEGQAGMLERWKINENDLSLYTAEEILKVAKRGNVLVRGWGATHVLRRVAHVPCVRICAPMSDRITEMAERLGLADEKVARREIERNDAAHARTIQNNFEMDYRDPLGYDMVLNTARTSIQVCAQLVEALAQSESFRVTDDSLQELERATVEAEIRSALRAVNRQGGLTPWFDLRFDPASGIATLRGTTYDERLREKAVEAVQAIPSVKQVRNEISIIVTREAGI